METKQPNNAKPAKTLIIALVALFIAVDLIVLAWLFMGDQADSGETEERQTQSRADQADPALDMLCRDFLLSLQNGDYASAENLLAAQRQSRLSPDDLEQIKRDHIIARLSDLSLQKTAQAATAGGDPATRLEYRADTPAGALYLDFLIVDEAGEPRIHDMGVEHIPAD